VVWLNALAGYFQAQVIQARERAQVGAIKGSIGHVEVFRMDGVGISIIERPRPLHNHDTPNPTHHTYTLKCEEPQNLGGSRRLLRALLLGILLGNTIMRTSREA